MPAPKDRRSTSERRDLLDRRMSVEQPGQRPGADRRRNGERRTGVERRLSIQSASDQIRGALRLLTRVIEMGAVAEQEMRSLESAMLRLRFALDRLEEP